MFSDSFCYSDKKLSW